MSTPRVFFELVGREDYGANVPASGTDLFFDVRTAFSIGLSVRDFLLETTGTQQFPEQMRDRKDYSIDPITNPDETNKI